MPESKIHRYLQWYDKTTEFAVNRETMKGIELESLQELFGVTRDNPMYECWEVNEEHRESIQNHVKHHINLKKFTYFVEASAIK